ncbi:serine/threonine-protein kinase pim-1-like [Agelaius phoeniceus]|uniref:serine/threonine-protein kinase pim-1-like n=1 Tax=Agelaius phoeniceus TaxID=39638 RepID=UPI0040553375
MVQDGNGHTVMEHHALETQDGRSLNGRSGAVAGPGPSADSRVPPAGKAHEALQERYRVGSLLGRGGFGSVFAATRLSDGAPVAIKRVPRNRVRHWGELPDGSRAPLEVVLQAKVSTGFPGVVQLLEWLELPNHIVMVLERPERCQDLQRFIGARRFLPEEVARALFRQVLEAVRHCTSCGVLHRDIKPENILLDLHTGKAKLIDFGCGTYLQDTAYTHFAGTLSYSPPEWIQHQRYHGEAATIWSLGLLLCHLVMGKHPFRRGQEIIRGRILFPQWLSQECQDIIKRCLSMQPSDRPSLEELFCHPWVLRGCSSALEDGRDPRAQLDPGAWQPISAWKGASKAVLSSAPSFVFAYTPVMPRGPIEPHWSRDYNARHAPRST